MFALPCFDVIPRCVRNRAVPHQRIPTDLYIFLTSKGSTCFYFESGMRNKAYRVTISSGIAESTRILNWLAKLVKLAVYACASHPLLLWHYVFAHDSLIFHPFYPLITLCYFSIILYDFSTGTTIIFSNLSLRVSLFQDSFWKLRVS